MAQEVSHRPITKYQSRSRRHKEVPRKVNGSHHDGDSPLLRSTGNQIATNPLPGPTNREHRKPTGVKTVYLGYELQLVLSLQVLAMVPIFRITSYTEDRLMRCPSDKNVLAFGGLLHENKLTRHFTTSNGADLCPNGSSNLLLLHIDSNLDRLGLLSPALRPAFSATKRKNYAQISFDQQVKISQGRTSYRNRKTEISRFMAAEALSW